MQLTQTSTALAKDTLEGLTSKTKRLSSKYFYDESGSKIFQQIMRMPEYYLTDCEYEIFYKQAHSIIGKANPDKIALEIIELGAGDGIKTKLLIKELFRQKIDFRYIPIDISEEILFGMAANMQKEFNELKVAPKAGDYFDMMEEIERYSETPKLILFLGSNIGNFTLDESVEFLSHLHRIIHPQDRLLIGFDLKKSPEVILKAYNDKYGLTRDFNLNLLKRLNEELGANFNLDNFEHAPLYDPQNGVAKSYLVSTCEQTVVFSALNRAIRFSKWETIYTEQSQKYDTEMIHNLAELSGFEVEKNFTDTQSYFMNSLWKPKQ